MPPAEILRPLVGDEIAQIRLDPYGVQFAFESGRVLTVQHAIEHVEPNGEPHRYDCTAAEGPPLLLHRLLYKPILAVERHELSFTLRFECGAALVVNTELGPYESGQLYPTKDGHDLIVF